MNTQTKEVNHEQAVPGGAKRLIREVKEHTRKRFSSEEKIRIVLEGFRGELPVSELCRKESVSTALYYSWLKDFMEAGKERLKKDYQSRFYRHSHGLWRHRHDAHRISFGQWS